MPADPAEHAVLLQMRGIDKSFPGVHALQRVSLELQRGEVLALVGENGAGKSTLIKVLAGAHMPDAGEILIDGQPVRMTSPHAAQLAGVSVIYQEFNLIPDMTVREKIFLGREKTRGGLIKAAEEHEEAAALFQRIGGGHRSPGPLPRSLGRSATDRRDSQGTFDQRADSGYGRANGGTGPEGG